MATATIPPLPGRLPGYPFVVIGHRGAAGVAPENSLTGFAYALDAGCPMLELDVYAIPAAAGGTVLCVIHDETLDRTTNRRGPVADLRDTDLPTVDPGDGRGIPTLNQVMDLMIRQPNRVDGRPAALNIELKGPDTAAPVAACLAERQSAEPAATPPVLVSSFDHKELVHFRSLDAHTPVAPLFHRWQSNWQDVAQSVSASAVNLSNRIVTRARIRAIREAGYPVFVYTVNRASRARRLADFGVTGVFTDYPERMAEWLL